jgi:hypothetical protein
MAKRIWNIPTELFSEYIKTKDGSEMLALAYCIKARFGSSCLFDFSPKKVKEICGCCIEKARLIYIRAKSDTTLFRYDEKNNVLFANKLTKEKKIGHYGKRNQFVAEYLDCVKVTLDTNFKLKDAIKLFRELSAAKMIETLANDKSNNEDKNNLCGGRCNLSLKTIGKLSGTSKSTAYRTTKAMRDKGLIGRDPTKSFHIMSDHDEIPFNSDFVIKRTKQTSDGIKFVINIAVEMGRWFIDSQDIKNTFSHIIFNHSKRLKSIVKNYSVDLTKPFGDDFSQEQLAAYFATMEH